MPRVDLPNGDRRWYSSSLSWSKRSHTVSTGPFHNGGAYVQLTEDDQIICHSGHQQSVTFYVKDLDVTDELRKKVSSHAKRTAFFFGKLGARFYFGADDAAEMEDLRKTLSTRLFKIGAAGCSRNGSGSTRGRPTGVKASTTATLLPSKATSKSNRYAPVVEVDEVIGADVSSRPPSAQERKKQRHDSLDGHIENFISEVTRLDAIPETQRASSHAGSPTKRTGSRRGATATAKGKKREPLLATPPKRLRLDSPDQAKHSLQFRALDDFNTTPTKQQQQDGSSPNGNNRSIPLGTRLSDGLLGFANIGNTCYMNAILQALLAVGPFKADLLTCSQFLPMRATSHKLLCSMVKLAQRHWEKSEWGQSSQLLRGVKSAISADAIRFSGSAQQDAHEFLGQVLDQLNEECTGKKTGLDDTAKSSKRMKEENVLLSSDDDNDVAIIEQRPVSSPIPLVHNPVTPNFSFTLHQNICCDQCGNVVLKEEDGTALALQLPNAANGDDIEKNLQWMLDARLDDEEIEYRCSECGCHSSVITHQFAKLPRCLLVYAKRVQFEVTRGRGRKLKADIDIPRYLTAEGLCVDGVEEPLPFVAAVEQLAIEPPPAPTLQVNGVVATTNASVEKRFPSVALFEDAAGKDKPEKTGVVSTREKRELEEALRLSKIEAERKSAAEQKTKEELEFEETIRLSMLEATAPPSLLDPIGMTEEEQIKMAMDAILAEVDASTSPSRLSKPLSPVLEDEPSPKCEAQEAVTMEEDVFWPQNASTICLDDNDSVVADSLASPNNSSQSSSTSVVPDSIEGEGESPAAAMLETERRNENDGDERVERRSPCTQDDPLSDDDSEGNSNEHAPAPSPTPNNSRAASSSQDTTFLLVGDTTKTVSLRFEPVDEEWRVTRCAALDIDLPNPNVSVRGQWSKTAHFEHTVNSKEMMPEDPPKKRLKTRADGNCLYRALSHVICRTEGNHKQIRHRIVEFMRGHRTDFVKWASLFDQISDGDLKADDETRSDAFDKYLKKTSKDGEWGGSTELIAVATMLQTDVLVYYMGRWWNYTPRFEIANLPKTFKSIYLVNEDYHYEPVLDVTNKKERQQKERREELRGNFETGTRSHSYRLTAVVSHLGFTSGSGHYVCDSWNPKLARWVTCDDSDVQKTTEQDVRQKRRSDGYVFVYLHKDACAVKDDGD